MVAAAVAIFWPVKDRGGGVKGQQGAGEGLRG